jgi:hypothetical protein
MPQVVLRQATLPVCLCVSAAGATPGVQFTAETGATRPPIARRHEALECSVFSESTACKSLRLIDLTPGMAIRIPRDARHNMVNTGWETILCLVTFSSGDRQTVFLK